jgi:hypothetical protein
VSSSHLISSARRAREYEREQALETLRQYLHHLNTYHLQGGYWELIPTSACCAQQTETLTPPSSAEQRASQLSPAAITESITPSPAPNRHAHTWSAHKDGLHVQRRHRTAANPSRCSSYAISHTIPCNSHICDTSARNGGVADEPTCSLTGVRIPPHYTWVADRPAFPGALLRHLLRADRELVDKLEAMGGKGGREEDVEVWRRDRHCAGSGSGEEVEAVLPDLDGDGGRRGHWMEVEELLLTASEMRRLLQDLVSTQRAWCRH